MAVSVVDVRSVDELVRVVGEGGQPKYLMFWGHQPAPGGGVGKGCFSQWWPAAFTVDGETYASAEHFMMVAKALLFGDTETVLVEASPVDRIWGTGLAADHEYSTSPEHWPGLNLLGFALMEVRHQLRAVA